MDEHREGQQQELPLEAPPQRAAPRREGEVEWTEPLHRIAWGMILTGLSLDFLWLNYILPIIGILMFYFGIRSIREENSQFRLVWRLAQVWLALYLIELILAAAPDEGFLPLWASVILFIIPSLVIRIMILWNLHRGIEEIYARGYLTPGRTPYKQMIIWMVVSALSLFSIFLLGPLALLAVIGVLIWGIVLLVSMYKLGTETGELEYGYVPAPVRVSGPVITLGYLAVIAGGILVACVLSNHLWVSGAEMAGRDASPMRQHLLELGVPGEILADLSNEAIASIPDVPVAMEFSTDYLWSDQNGRYGDSIEPDAKNVFGSRTFYLLLPDDRVAVIEHFTFSGNAPVWQGGLSIHGSFSEYGGSGYMGQLIYDKNGVSYEMPIPDFAYGYGSQYDGQQVDYFQDMFFFGYGPIFEMTGRICYPFGATEGRGYICYTMNSAEGQPVYYQSATYESMDSFFRYPYRNSLARITQGMSSFDSRQHYSSATFWNGETDEWEPEEENYYAE